MTQLVKKSEQGIQSLSDKIKTGLSEIKAEKQVMKAQRGTVFLLDCSGSMSESVDGRSKILHLEGVMRDYQARKVGFSDSVFAWQQGIRPAGNTDMALAFRHLQSQKPEKVVMISDGCPNDEDGAIKEAVALHVPVNIVYIGEKGDRGEAFMKRLAIITGGKTFTAETHNPQFVKRLSHAIAGYLPAGGN